MTEHVVQTKVVILNSPPACVDGDTEYATPTGWKKISEFKEGDKVLTYYRDGSARFVEPDAYIVSEEPVKFIDFLGTHCDMRLTENHRIVYLTSDANKWREKSALEFHRRLTSNKYGFGGRVPCAFDIDSEDYPISDEELRFIVMYSADGQLLNERTGYSKISVKRDYKKARVEEILKSVGVEYKASNPNSMPGYCRYHFITPHAKGLPDYFYSLSQRQMQIVKNELIFWDGDRECAYRTTLQNELDIAQFVFSSCGLASYVKVDDRVGEIYGAGYVRKSICYEVRYAEKRNACFGLESIKSEVSEYEGTCYCFTTESGMWVARRAGKIFITGNCGKDVGAQHLAKTLTSMDGILVRQNEFKARLNELVCTIHGMDSRTWSILCKREHKDRPSSVLGGKTPRQVQIEVSEKVIKPFYGKDYFGKAAAQSLYADVEVFSDGGFVEEIEALVSSVGKENVLIIRIHQEGKSFEATGDSRRYLPDGLAETVDLHNNGTLDEYLDSLKNIVEGWLNK